jgi:hypothetical protein
MGRVVSKFVPADELVVPYTATSLDDAEAIIHVVKVSENELRKQQVSGFYRDVELGPPDNVEKNDLEKKERELDGTKKTGKQESMYTLLECHVNLDLEGFEDVGSDGEPTGIKLPYPLSLFLQISARTWILWLRTHSHDWRIEPYSNYGSPSVARCRYTC